MHGEGAGAAQIAQAGGLPYKVASLAPRIAWYMIHLTASHLVVTCFSIHASGPHSWGHVCVLLISCT